MPKPISDFFMIRTADYDRNPVFMMRILLNLLRQRERFPFLLRYCLKSIANIAVGNGLDDLMKLIEDVDQAGPSQLDVEKHGNRPGRQNHLIPNFSSWSEKAIPALIEHLEILETSGLNSRRFESVRPSVYE